jgi:hypothetical protein
MAQKGYMPRIIFFVLLYPSFPVSFESGLLMAHQYSLICKK